jgi:hypothetical protein
MFCRKSLFVCFFIAGCVISTFAEEYKDSINVGYKTQLFVDDYIVNKYQNVERKVQPATKMNKPVMVSKRPWETEINPNGQDGKRVLLYGTVFYDPLQKQYRMWYMGRLGNHCPPIPELEIPGENVHGDLTFYAESKDGITWKRPDLGLVHFDGDPENNIMLDFHGASVFLDQDEIDPQKRYKAIGFMRRFHDIRVCYSPDGIHWSAPQQASDRSNEGAFNACYALALKRYVAGSIELSSDMTYSYIDCEGDRQGKRVAVALCTGGKDLKNWTHKTYINPDEKDEPNTQFYGMTPFTYGDNGLIFGFLHVFHVIDPQACFHDGPIEAQLVYSRDGLTWHRMEDRRPVIPLGPEGSYDGGMIMMTANGAFVKDDELIAYYTASKGGHGNQDSLTAGMASWPLDRFVALEAGQDEGTIETKLITAPKGKLIINADAKGGYVTAEILNASGEVQAGFSSDRCRYLVKDSLKHEFTWKDKDISEAKKPLRLRFKLKNAKLYSFKFVK